MKYFPTYSSLLGVKLNIDGTKLLVIPDDSQLILLLFITLDGSYVYSNTIPTTGTFTNVINTNLIAFDKNNNIFIVSSDSVADAITISKYSNPSAITYT